MLGYLAGLDVEAEGTDSDGFLFTMTAEPALVRKVIETQLGDEEVRFILDDVLSKIGLEGWCIKSDQGLRYQVACLCRSVSERMYYRSFTILILQCIRGARRCIRI